MGITHTESGKLIGWTFGVGDEKYGIMENAHNERYHVIVRGRTGALHSGKWGGYIPVWSKVTAEIVTGTNRGWLTSVEDEYDPKEEFGDYLDGYTEAVRNITKRDHVLVEWNEKGISVSVVEHSLGGYGEDTMVRTVDCQTYGIDDENINQTTFEHMKRFGLWIASQNGIQLKVVDSQTPEV